MTAKQPNAQVTSKIIWGALTLSMIIYGVVLQTLGKMSFFAMPTGVGEPVELLALVAPLMIFASLMLNKILKGRAKDAQGRMTAMIVSLALNETIAMLGFVATFISPEGNGFFYAANTLVALVGNLLVFPSDI